MEYQDLVYFGGEYDPDSKQHQIEFIKEIKEKFPNVELKDAYDYIKGFRQEVYIDKAEDDNYWSWLIAHGWLECSLGGQLMKMDSNEKERLLRYIELAKQQYPDNFKKSNE